jgi:Mrp family chromosome partitioning ATPase
MSTPDDDSAHDDRDVVGLTSVDDISGPASAPGEGSRAEVEVLTPGSVRRLDEAARQLLHRRTLTIASPLPTRIAVVGSRGGEGASTLAATLASVLAADNDDSVAVVDLSNIATGPDEHVEATVLDDVVDRLRRIDDVIADLGESDIPVLRLADMQHGAWYSRVTSGAFSRTINELAERFDHIVFDMPPMLVDARAMTAMRYVDAYVMVVRHGRTQLSDVQEMNVMLTNVAALGLVLNRESSRVPRVVRRWLYAT